MPDVSTKVDLCRGHDACPPRAFATFSVDVFAEGFEVVRQEDQLQDHGCPVHVPHGAIIRRGFQTVKVNGHPVGYVGATVSCPSGEVNTGRPSVKIAEGAVIRLR
jgi:uncharacterized Zn-binding protein involved in type VI secretion